MTMKPPPGAGERHYPHGRMGTGTGPKPTAAETGPEFSLVRDDLDDDARWQAEEDAAAELIARETSAPRVVEPDSIDSADLAARDCPSAAEAHAADLLEQLERANSSIVTMARSLSRVEAERREWAAKLAEAQRPRQHRLVSSLLTLLRGDR